MARGPWESIVRIQMLPSASGMYRALTHLANDLTDRSEPIEQAVDDVIRPTIGANFRTQGGISGDGWAPWSPDTPFMPYHRDYGPAQGILHVTGTLYDEATTKKIWGFQGKRGQAVAYGNRFVRAPYARFMQDGTMTNPGLGDHRPIPARPFIRISDREVREIGEVFGDWFENSARKNILRAYV